MHTDFLFTTSENMHHLPTSGFQVSSLLDLEDEAKRLVRIDSAFKSFGESFTFQSFSQIPSLIQTHLPVLHDPLVSSAHLSYIPTSLIISFLSQYSQQQLFEDSLSLLVVLSEKLPDFSRSFCSTFFSFSFPSSPTTLILFVKLANNVLVDYPHSFSLSYLLTLANSAIKHTNVISSFSILLLNVFRFCEFGDDWTLLFHLLTRIFRRAKKNTLFCIREAFSRLPQQFSNFFFESLLLDEFKLVLSSNCTFKQIALSSLIYLSNTPQGASLVVNHFTMDQVVDFSDGVAIFSIVLLNNIALSQTIPQLDLFDLFSSGNLALRIEIVHLWCTALSFGASLPNEILDEIANFLDFDDDETRVVILKTILMNFGFLQFFDHELFEVLATSENETISHLSQQILFAWSS